MDLVIGVVGMLVLAGVYVALGLADHGEDACEGCLLRGDPEGGCLTCPEATRPREESAEPASWRTQRSPRPEPDVLRRSTEP